MLMMRVVLLDEALSTRLLLPAMLAGAALLAAEAELGGWLAGRLLLRLLLLFALEPFALSLPLLRLLRLLLLLAVTGDE